MLLEIAIGDAYGAGFEFCAREKIRRHNHLSSYVPHELGIHAGHYTDDTQMSIAVAQVLLASPPHTSALFAESFVACYRRDPRQGYATRFQTLLGECADGAALRARIHPQSRRNGAAMRSVPLGLIADKATLLETAKQQAAITHDTPEGIVSSQIVALMAHALLYEGASLAVLPGLIRDDTGFVLDLDWHAEVACDALQTLHAVATALHRNRRLSALLLDCVNFGGDVDSVAAIALGLASLSPEYSNDIPAVLVSSLESGPYGGDFLAGLDRQLAEHFPALSRLPVPGDAACSRQLLCPAQG